jgi:CHAT domain-containing protein
LSRFFLSDREGQVVSVFANDLPALALRHVDLVVLASCRGADGPLSRSEGLVSLARAFLLQGVPSVLVARWDVEDESTSRFMERFYTHLGKSEPPAVAFTRAIREFQQYEPSNDSWTGWLLIGAR